MMNRPFSLIQTAALFTVVALLSQAGSAQTPKKCRAADTRSLALIRELQEWETTTDPQRIASRDNIFHIPVVASNQITLVTDEKVCAKMVTAYTSKMAYTPTSLYVIKIGTKGYAGYDPDRLHGEFTSLTIFNTKFVYIGGWTG